MSLATTYEQKKSIISDFLSKMAPDEKKIMLQMLIKDDMKLFFDTIFAERKFLEEETGVDGAFLEEETECKDTSSVYWGTEESGKVSKEAENAYFLDEKRKEKLGNDKFDGFLGYISDKESEEETRYEPKLDEIIDKKILLESKESNIDGVKDELIEIRSE